MPEFPLAFSRGRGFPFAQAARPIPWGGVSPFRTRVYSGTKPFSRPGTGCSGRCFPQCPLGSPSRRWRTRRTSGDSRRQDRWRDRVESKRPTQTSGPGPHQGPAHRAIGGGGGGGGQLHLMASLRSFPGRALRSQSTLKPRASLPPKAPRAAEAPAPAVPR